MRLFRRVEPVVTYPDPEDEGLRAPAVLGTTWEKMREAVEFSEAGRRRMYELIAMHVPRARREAERRHGDGGMRPPTDYEVGYYAEKRAESDPSFEAALSHERWGYRLATMYAGVQLVNELVTTNALLGRLAAAQEETNRLLNDVLLAVSTETRGSDT